MGLRWGKEAESPSMPCLGAEPLITELGSGGTIFSHLCGIPTHARLLHALFSLVLTTTGHGIFYSVHFANDRTKTLHPTACDHLYPYIPQATVQTFCSWPLPFKYWWHPTRIRNLDSSWFLLPSLFFILPSISYHLPNPNGFTSTYFCIHFFIFIFK